MTNYITKNGKEYVLDMMEGSVLYHWVGSGVNSKAIDGGFLCKPDAVAAMKFYDEHVLQDRKRPSVESTPLIELDKLSKKAPLLEFAAEYGIDVPEALTLPVQIKKMIKAQLEEVNA